MRINKIKLVNYRCYYKEQTIEIPDIGTITIVRGENGAGKTALINGVTWCLYNEKASNKELINDKAIYDAEAGSRVEMYVEVHFTHLGAFYILRRAIAGTKADDSLSKLEEEYILTIVEDGQQETVAEEIQVENRINNILNESVKNYFFFDGARIETFTRDDHNRDVERAIKNLLKIETIKRARDHINVINDEIRNNIDSTSEDDITRSINYELEVIKGRLAKLNEDLSKVTQDLSAVEKDIENTEKEIRKIEENSVQKEKKTEANTKRDKEIEELRELECKLRSQLANSYTCFAHSLMKDVLERIAFQSESYGRKFQIDATREIIKESIQKRCCYICGQEIKEDVRKRLLEKLPQLITESADYPNLMRISEAFGALKKEGENLYESVAVSKRRANEHIKEIDKCEEIIGRYDDLIDDELPDIREHKDMLRKLREKRDKVRDKNRDIEKEISELRGQRKSKEEDYNKALQELREYEKERANLRICQRIREELNRIYEQYEKTEIQKINEQTKRVFDLIIRKKNFYTDIFIDGQYALNVHREYSPRNVLRDLSFGERQILSVSLITALAKVSGDEGPFVMDTPMANLDPIHRKKLVTHIPKYMDQILMLVTSSEFTEDLYDLCEGNISGIYELHTVSKGMTQIRQEN